VLEPYIQSGLVDWIEYPPKPPSHLTPQQIRDSDSTQNPFVQVSALNNYSEDGLLWHNEDERRDWISDMRHCRYPESMSLRTKFEIATNRRENVGTNRCQGMAYVEVLASWRMKTRWLISFDVDEYFYVKVEKVSIFIRKR
jgi:hypothetical protein